MDVYNRIIDELTAQADAVQAAHLMRFFKTGEGEYGYGDRFLGLKVPQTRAIVRKYRADVSIADLSPLIASEFHEVRLAGLLLLVEIYKRLKKCGRGQEAVRYYLSVLDRGNNWDLVDLVAPKILGDWLLRDVEGRRVLYDMVAEDGRLWRQRVGIVATWTLICNGEFDDTLRLSELLLGHEHDLIHKAVGWMLREVGKRGGRHRLLEFVARHGRRMPRTMLRYAIEHLPENQRQEILRSTR